MSFKFQVNTKTDDDMQSWASTPEFISLGVCNFHRKNLYQIDKIIPENIKILKITQGENTMCKISSL